MIIIKYNGEEVQIQTGKYADNDRLAIQLVDEEGYPYLTATINIPHAELKDNETLIKNWSENVGILSWLHEYGIVTALTGSVPTGMVEAARVIIDKNRLKELEGDDDNN